MKRQHCGGRFHSYKRWINSCIAQGLYWGGSKYGINKQDGVLVDISTSRRKKFRLVQLQGGRSMGVVVRSCRGVDY